MSLLPYRITQFAIPCCRPPLDVFFSDFYRACHPVFAACLRHLFYAHVFYPHVFFHNEVFPNICLFFIGRHKEQTILYHIVLNLYIHILLLLLPTFGHYCNIVVEFYFCLNVILCYVICYNSSVTIRINIHYYILYYP